MQYISIEITRETGNEVWNKLTGKRKSSYNRNYHSKPTKGVLDKKRKKYNENKNQNLELKKQHCKNNANDRIERKKTYYADSSSKKRSQNYAGNFNLLPKRQVTVTFNIPILQE